MIQLIQTTAYGWRTAAGIRRSLRGSLLLLAILVGSVTCAAQDHPDWPRDGELIAALRQGLKTRSGGAEVIAVRAMHVVRVDQNEDAFLVSVWFPDRGRNFLSGTFLYRPALRQARELDYSQSLGLQYVSGRYGEFALLEIYGAGQGSENFVHSLVRFKGWDAVVLHKAGFGSNLGSCGDNSLEVPVVQCEQTGVRFQLLKTTERRGVELVEITTLAAGHPKQTVHVTSRRFRLDGDRFMPVNGQ